MAAESTDKREQSDGAAEAEAQAKAVESEPSKAAASGAAKFLADLPSRGFFYAIPSSNLGGMRVYICDHDTTPPEEQVIKTDTTNILIRALEINKQKNEMKEAADKATAESKGKRCAAKTLEGKGPAKRANTGGASGTSKQEGSSSGPSEKILQTLTVERLRALLRERGLSQKGKKDELIARLKNEGS